MCITVSGRGFSATCLLLAACWAVWPVPIATADTVVYDHFDGGVLDPAWTVTMELATGWTYELLASNLTVTDIEFTEFHGDWSNVILSQEFAPLDDLTVNITLGWDSDSQNSAMQNVMVVLRDITDDDPVIASYHDAWDQNRGRLTAIVGDAVHDGPNNLPHSGTGSFEIMRSAGAVTINWEGGEILSGTAETAIDRLELWFMVGAWPTATFGQLSVDLISCDGDLATPVDMATWGSIKKLYR